MSRHCPLIAPATPCHTHQLMSRVTWPEHRVLQGIVFHSIQEKKIHYHQKHDLSSSLLNIPNKHIWEYSLDSKHNILFRNKTFNELNFWKLEYLIRGQYFVTPRLLGWQWWWLYSSFSTCIQSFSSHRDAPEADQAVSGSRCMAGGPAGQDTSSPGDQWTLAAVSWRQNKPSS